MWATPRVRTFKSIPTRSAEVCEAVCSTDPGSPLVASRFEDPVLHAVARTTQRCASRSPRHAY